MLNKYKQTISVIVGGIVLIVVLTAWYYYSTTEEITITANVPSAILSLTGKDYPQGKKIGEGKVTTRVNLGDYTVKAADGSKETRAGFSLKKGSPVRLELTITDVKTPKRLENTGAARNILATNTTLQYLNPAFEGLDMYTIDQEYAQPLNPLTGIRSVSWVSPTQAYISEKNGFFSFMDGDKIISLDSPNNPFNNILANAVAPNGAIAYATGDKKVFVRPNALAAPAYNLQISAWEPEIVLGDKNRLLIYDTAISPDSTHVIRTQPEVYEGAAKLEQDSAALKDFNIEAASWSPDASNLIFGTSDGVYTLNVATGSVKLIYHGANTHANSFKWITNDSLLYFLDQTIWRVNLPNQTWVKIAYVDASVNTSEPFAVSPDGKTGYFAADNKDGDGISGAIYSFPLD